MIPVEVDPHTFVETLTPTLFHAASVAANSRDTHPLLKQHEDGPPGAETEASRSSRVDVVSEVDLCVQELLLSTIHERWPFVSVLAEEETPLKSKFPEVSRFCVLVDPLDGTRNFLSGDKNYCHIVSLMDRSEMVASLVYSHATEQLLCAVRGEGTTIASQSNHSTLVGSPEAAATRIFHHVSRVPPEVVLGIGSLGFEPVVSTQNASDILTILRGEASGFVSYAPLIYDVWSPGMLVREAGGWMSDWVGQPLMFDRKARLPHVMVASSAAVASSLIDMMSRCQSHALRDYRDSTSGA